MVIAIGSNKLYYPKNSLWKGLRTCHETGYVVVVVVVLVVLVLVVIVIIIIVIIIIIIIIIIIDYKYEVFHLPLRHRTDFLNVMWKDSTDTDKHIVIPFYLFKIHFNIIFPSMPTSSRWSLHLRFLHQYIVCISLLLLTRHTSWTPLPPRFVDPYNVWWTLQITELLTMRSIFWGNFKG